MKLRNDLRPVAIVLSGLLLASLACNLGAGGDDEPSTPPPAQEQEPAQRQASGGVASLDEVRNAVVQIEAEGSFVSPEDFGIYVGAGRGSGFIIDPSGIAVTNNHVVTGAGLLRVWVGGDTTQTYNARVLGVSECSDLAVIDIDGDDFPYLDWYQDPVNVGLDIYAAGFPLGDPEFTLTRGIVAKAQADGEWSWASVNSSIEHDANIQPGNSGGPLINPEGRVVGINYAGFPGPTGTQQFFAIGTAEALRIIDDLRVKTDVTSIGVNGEAFDLGDLSGIWVYSVKSGSPADQAGIRGGDIITTLEGLPMGAGGTMADYCDVLRTHGPEEVLSVEVLRYQDGKYLTGQLNGRPLAVEGVFGQELANDVQDTGSGYQDYTEVTDDYGSIVVEVPTTWGEVDGAPWVDGDEVIGASIWAAPDMDGFANTWGTPGVKFEVSDDLAKLGGYIQVLDFYRHNTYVTECELDGRYDYDDSYYRGSFDYFVKCGGSGGPDYLILSAVPVDSSVQLILVVQVQILTESDLDAADRILATFDVVGPLP